jgi:leader peptidase (prepilin peptidase)/N-methyltransferase
MTIALIIIFGLLGLAIGSFLNVCIDRLPARKSLAFPPSHCDACGHPLSIRDLFPVVSYLWLRGRCRYCGAHIPIRVPLVEIGTGVLLAILFWKHGLTLEFPVTAFYSLVLLVLAVIDLEHKLILNVITYPVSAVALIVGYYGPTWQLIMFGAYACVLLVLGLIKPNDSLAISFIVYCGIAIAVVMNVFMQGNGDFNVFVGGAIGFVILLIPALVSRSGMGWGDVKMAGMIGLMTGFPRVLVAILGGIILGGLTATALIIMRKKGRKDMIPFGPFLSLATLVTFLYGNQIISWYLNLF